jgi:NAD(P)-dependent dehydrogenase (short-subunit alcohol dehydrogenase family)
MSILDKFSLEGKVAVVTGASRNVGLSIARGFAEAGATVFMIARDESVLGRAAESVRSGSGSRIETVVADVGSRAGSDHVIATVHGEFSQIDVLVNNALSVGGEGHPFDLEDSAWDEALAVNVLGPFRLCRGFGKPMLAGRGGSIVNVVSGSGFLPRPRHTVYGSTKAAMWMMTRYLATECAPKVRVNALMPGLVRNDTAGWSWGDDTTGKLEALTPMKRVGDPDEVAPAALYLASDASSFTTGELLIVNGGRVW